MNAIEACYGSLEGEKSKLEKINKKMSLIVVGIFILLI
jgi:hypothetical protein